jgi:HlyD family secretion protein
METGMHGSFSLRNLGGLRRKVSARRLAALGLGALVLIAAGFYFFPDRGSGPAEGGYRFAKTERGEIVATVNATGTINPITTVIVGSQLSGQVVQILADYNSEVKADQVVARLNSDQIRARLDAARADLTQMRAQRQVQEGQIAKVKAETEKAHAAQADAEAQVARNEALLGDAEKIFQRQSELRARGYAAEQALDTARTNRDAQQAALNSAKAQVNSAKAAISSLAADLLVAQANLAAVTAQITQREAAVRQIEVDLRNTDIRSPVSGVVVQRNVELGQTVAASLQAPELFRIADDLRFMEIAANIDETDVGRIKTGQRASFTVNAFPGRTFEGTVKQVRLGSQTVNNVVIYTTIISIENPRRELLPGMTANLRIETDRREDVVRIPNAALRWRPSADTPLTATPAAGAQRPARQGQGTAQGGGRGNLTEFARAVKTELKLTPDQSRQIDDALADMSKGFMSAMAGAQDQAARRERARALRQELDDRIAGLLDAEQRPAFAAIRERFAGSNATAQAARVFVLGPDGKPEGVSIRVGASDGAQTEVVSGLEADRQVIIGGGPASDAQRNRPRFGF